MSTNDTQARAEPGGLWQLLLSLLSLGVIAGHITHIMVTGVIFDGTRARVRELAEINGGGWAKFHEGFTCQLCSGVWYSSVISAIWTTGLRVLRPRLWNDIAGRDLKRLNVPAWTGMFVAQSFFIAAVGHLFREFVGLVEDQRTREEEEAAVLEKTARRIAA